MREMRRIGFAAVIGLLVAGMRAEAGFQSPIDIRSDNTAFSVLPAFQFQYDAGVTLDVVNTGSPGEFSTVRANVPTGAGELTLDGETYNLLQFHFHTEAEHLINGHRAEMELHMVHQSLNGVLLVVGRLIELGAFNPDLGSIFSNLPQNSGDHVSVSGFNLGALLPNVLDSFRYDGSLTTPPFTEGVEWNVLLAPLEMAQSQIDSFRGLFPDGNSRDVQPLDGRVVLTDVSGFAAVPEPPSLALVGIGGLVGLGYSLRKRRGA